MIERKKLYAILTVIAYVILGYFCFHSIKKYHKEYTTSSSENCFTHDKPCMRFCSKDGKSDEELFVSFANSNYSNLRYRREEVGKGLKVRLSQKEEVSFTILRGEPECSLAKIENPLENCHYGLVSFDNKFSIKF